MARRQAPLQVNQFTGGLNTDSNPLNMPPNFSIDELNMEIEVDGSRSKRLGFDYEPSHSVVDTGILLQSQNQLFTTTFRWDNAGGDARKSLLVVQVGNYLAVHDMDSSGGVSANKIYEETFSTTNYSGIFSYAVVDSLLAVVNSEKSVLVYEYDAGTITKTTDNLLIRDLFGVESGELTQQDNLNKRPSTLSNTHLYNLRNQTFYSPRFRNVSNTSKDPIESFTLDHADNKFPSNADDLNRFLLADPNVSANRTIERFFSRDMVETTPAVGEAPRGHFIIDALDRGASRKAKEEELRADYSELVYEVNGASLPVDRTPGGASVIEHFAGRFWYAGFPTEIIGGDSKSPRMSSYVLFSKLVKDKTDITQCYQQADPTSNEDSALVDTDGGFIKLEDAYGISKLINLAGSLFVFATNGVWSISGDEGSSFTATTFQANKLSSEGSVSPNAVVVVGDEIFFWSEKGIFNVARNQFGFWEFKDITKSKIEKFYLDIPEKDKQVSNASYDIYTKKIRWVYAAPSDQATESNELILDLDFGAFTHNKIGVVSSGAPLVVNLTPRQSTKVDATLSDVTVNGINVTVNGVNLTVDSSAISDALRQSIYLIITGYSPTITYSLGYYRDEGFYDWTNMNYSAYLISGGLTGGEARFRKQTPYLNIFFKRTETGFDANFDPLTPSSCMVSAQWDWTSSDNSYRWSTPRETYRYPNLYFPANTSDTFDTGDTVVTTRNKIRGSGHSVSFKFDSVEGKNMYIHGWSFDLIASAQE